MSLPSRSVHSPNAGIQKNKDGTDSAVADHGIAVADSDLEAETPSTSDLETRLREKSRAYDNSQREIEELTSRCQQAEDKVESLGRLVDRIKDARSPTSMSMRSPSPTGDAGVRVQDAERKMAEMESQHKEKLAALEGDYQTAVRYVKGTEKMLKRMKVSVNATFTLELLMRMKTIELTFDRTS